MHAAVVFPGRLVELNADPFVGGEGGVPDEAYGAGAPVAELDAEAGN